jgi:uncharacterized protein YbbK (DUF523 family)
MMDYNRQNVTDFYNRGARGVIHFLETHLIKLVVLKSLGPACSKNNINDVNFSGKIKSGIGVLASFLFDYRIEVFDKLELESACQCLQKLESER